MKRKTYHITKTETGWEAKAEGNERASFTAETKEAIIQKTTESAKAQGNASVVIHKADGKIQEERTYGNDPFPPKG
jgi:hypothetical protein